MSAVPTVIEGSVPMSVCPCGGHHDFQNVKDNDFWAGLGAGATPAPTPVFATPHVGHIYALSVQPRG